MAELIAGCLLTRMFFAIEMGVPILDVRVNVAKQAYAAAATRYSPRKRRDYYRPALLAPRAAIAAICPDIVVSVAGAVTALQLYCCLAGVTATASITSEQSPRCSK